MIRMSELILNIRQRLRDTNKPYRYEQSELLDALNRVYCDLIYQFKLNVYKFTKYISPNDCVFTAPKMIISFEKAFLNNKALAIKVFDDKAQNLQVSVYSNMQSVVVLPTHKANGTLELYLNLAQSLNENSQLESADFLHMALIYGTLALIFQIESNEGNLQRVQFYESLFKKECDFLRASFSSVSEGKSFLSPCIQF